jgi:hypothetical protein
MTIQTSPIADELTIKFRTPFEMTQREFRKDADLTLDFNEVNVLIGLTFKHYTKRLYHIQPILNYLLQREIEQPNANEILRRSEIEMLVQVFTESVKNDKQVHVSP